MGVISRLVDRTVNRTANPTATGPTNWRGPIVDLVVGTPLFRDSFDADMFRAAGHKVVGLTIATRWPNLRGSLSGWHFRSQGMPRSATRSDMAMARWLIDRIHGWCAASGSAPRLVMDSAGLRAVLVDDSALGVFIGVQGGHVLEGDVANVARLASLGVSMFAPAHVMDNTLVGSGTGRAAGGLGPFGREVLAELEKQRVIVDLAHMSAVGVRETLPLLTRPFTLSHTGLTSVAGGRSRWRRYSPATRNVSADIATEVARRGGLLGIVLATQLIGGDTIADVARTVRAAVASAGGENVALGSDTDGALRMAVGPQRLAVLGDALLEAGLSRAAVDGVMGWNALRFLNSALA